MRQLRMRNNNCVHTTNAGKGWNAALQLCSWLLVDLRGAGLSGHQSPTCCTGYGKQASAGGLQKGEENNYVYGGFGGRRR
jgi:hypothetical protein